MELNGAEIIPFKDVRKSINSGTEVARHVQIPLYQRPYRWGDPEPDGEVGKRIKDLISDFFSHLEISAHNNDYFAGSIVSVFEKRKKTAIQELVDGQQRYTTLYLINFLGYLFSVKTFIHRYQQIIKTEAFKSDDEFSKSILETDINSNLSNIKLHTDELFHQTAQYQDGMETFKTKIMGSLNSTIPLEEKDFQIFDVSYVLNNKLGSLVLQYDRKNFNDSLRKVLEFSSLDIINSTEAQLRLNEDRLTVLDCTFCELGC